MAWRSSLPIRFFALVAALSAVLQWSIPHGWMISSDGHGHVSLVPCPSAAPELASLGSAMVAADDLHDGHHHDSMHHGMDHGDDEGSEGSAQSLCDQVAMGAAILAPQPPDFIPPQFRNRDALLPSFEVAPGRGLAAPPPPSTGPPLLKA